ncbi:hypothetical protein TPSD3_08875 [Thioflexithrix psekupsensis]|uniref:GmrSD restriction endonucleases C-terminal domain-containing protein n=1 Tax=Thioflexithrix psekupsensis TaxID=1570016 RepID=A0A251XA65_9GAMM|nr:hypothetical protein TPSD3_08875 [Thioflexithrix psekupsensis]
MLLNSLESAFKHQEPVDFDNLSIEHILPQHIENQTWWQTHLGGEWETIHELYKHTLGNLTLTGYNSQLSNLPFPDKKEKLQESHLELNKYFKNISVWNAEEIEKRAEYLAELALKVWPYFGDRDSSHQNANNVTGKSPLSISLSGDTLSVKTWAEVLVFTLNKIAELEPEQFVQLAENYPHFLGKDSSRFRRPVLLNNGYYAEKNMPGKRIYTFCIQAVKQVGLSSEEWTLTF